MIKNNYDAYDAFIVIHGTDTLAYTASMLSFVLENLTKPVILTGSQIPILELKNDAFDNFLGSLLIGSQYLIPEVMIFFGNKLIRGNRAKKVSTGDILAFDSPSYGLLGEVGVNFVIHWKRIIYGRGYEGELNVFKDLNDEISTININPCINLKVVESILSNSKAVIVQAYGMGNIPTKNVKLMNMLSEAINNDVIIVIMTQCAQGGVNDLYETGRYLVDLGAVLAFDMTFECVTAKLSYLMGK